MMIINKVKKYIPWQIKAYIKQKLLEGKIREIASKKNDRKQMYGNNGVNLIGSIRAEMGLGQSCRLVANQIVQSQTPLSVYNFGFNGELRENDTTYVMYESDELPFYINIFHVNPCELGKMVRLHPEFWENHYNIAFWLWELEEFPKEWISYCQLFDEIWTPSDFAGVAVRKVTKVPIHTLPYNVDAVYDEQIQRKDFGLPEDKFLFLIMYDLNSTNSRKNPKGAIEAYKLAFAKERKDCGIVIKINNCVTKNLERLKEDLKDYKNVYFITEIMEKKKVNSLIKCVDVFVSLHRAEGFGLVMAEAMQLGTPCIATDYSSNTEFMSKESSCMVGYRMTTIKKQEGLYKKGYKWAEPDIHQAAKFMQRLKDDSEYYDEKVKNGQAYIEEKLGVRPLTELWKSELSKRLDFAEKE